MNIKPTAFTLKSSGGKLNVLSTLIEVYQPNSNNPIRINAIWDTGATGTAITSNVANTLGLVATGVKQVHTANGLVLQNTYVVNIGLPNKIVIEGIAVTEVPSLSGGCDALVGMDIIGLGDFSITNLNGTTCMTFRVPSMHEIDYTKNLGLIVRTQSLPTINNLSLGRNDKCTCGSGKKFKQCCGKS